MSMSYQPPSEGPRPPAWTPPRSTGPTPMQWVLIATGVSLGLMLAALMLTSKEDAPPAAAATTMAPMTAPPAPIEPEPEPLAVPQRQEPQVTNDFQAAFRIARMAPPERDAALCAFVGQSDPSANAGLLERNPGRFLGHLWVFDGDVIQVEDIPDRASSFMLGSLGDEAASTVAVITHQPPPDSVITGRTVRVYGRIAGTFTYNTRAGNESTVPKVMGTVVILRREAPRCRRR